MGQTLDDMQPQTRRLLMLIDDMVGEVAKQGECTRDQVRLTLREIREYTGWGHTQIKVHIARLVDREFLVLHRAGPGQRYVYELYYDGAGKDGRSFVNGLIDVEKLKELAAGGAGRGLVGGVSGPTNGESTVREHKGNRAA